MTNETETLDIEKFNPTVAEIQKIVDEGKAFTITDFSDRVQIKAVHDQRLQLKDIRVTVTKQGKAFRQQAVDFQKKIIEKEKELVALVEPEEERLSGLEDQATAFEEREKRRELLPKRLDRLASLKDGVEISEEEILNMESTDFEGYCNKRLADKNEKDRLVLEAKEIKLKEAESKATREKEIKEAEDRARTDERKRADEADMKLKDERERAEKESKERIAREEKESRERADKIERDAKDKVEREEKESKERADKIERDAKEKVEREELKAKEAVLKLASDKKYQDFLASCGWTEKTASEFYIEVKGSSYSIYKKVGEITL